MPNAEREDFLFASDFDQTLSFHDSGRVLADLLGISGFEARVEGLARSNLVQQGGELAYLIRHDPAFRVVRREHLIETGRRVRLKHAIPELMRFLNQGWDGVTFAFYVISAAPREIVVSALDGIVPADHIFGTELEFAGNSGEVQAIKRVPAGYGKVAVLDELEAALDIAADRVIYVGDGSSDVHVMLHVNNRDGFTIAVSENQQLAQIARSTVLSENVFSVMVPILHELVGWRSESIRTLCEASGLSLTDWILDPAPRKRVTRSRFHSASVAITAE